MTIPIHVVFQGGGARFMALLAAAEALQELQTTNDLRIASVSGTSAGSLAAAMVATNQPIDRFKSRIKMGGTLVGTNLVKLVR
jgi:predicted acylesterase/phospholipase RssA